MNTILMILLANQKEIAPPGMEVRMSEVSNGGLQDYIQQQMEYAKVWRLVDFSQVEVY